MASAIERANPILDTAKLRAIYTAMLKLRTLHGGRRRVASGPVAVLAGVLSQVQEGDAVAGFPEASITAVFPDGSPYTVPQPRESVALFQIANGAALAGKARDAQAAVALFCSGPVLDRAVDAALAYAATHALPVVYVQEQTGDVRGRAWKQSFPSIPVDRDDAIAVYRVAYESLQRARQGGGPTWIECKPWKAQSRGGGGETAASDPMAKLESYIRAKGLDFKAWKGAAAAAR